MALTRDQFEDLLEYLREHPEARDELRPVVLGPVHDAVPSRLDRIEAALDRLIERDAEWDRRHQEINEQIAALGRRIDEVDQRLGDRIERLGERIEQVNQQLGERIDRLGERIEQVNQQVQAVVLRIDRLAETAENNNRQFWKYANLDGRLLEEAYARNVRNWFPNWLRRPRVAHIIDLPEVQAAIDAGVVSDAEEADARRLDLLVAGEAKDGSPGTSYIGCEFSGTIDADDVHRVRRRVATLRKAGLRAIPLVGGYAIDALLEESARADGVIVDIRST